MRLDELDDALLDDFADCCRDDWPTWLNDDS